MGSTQDQRDRAHKMFSEGNDLFFKRDYARAIEAYNRALAVFDHPRIQLALARTLLRVGRPADAHPHLVSALRWGAAPLDEEEYAEALDQQAALAKLLGVLIVRCRTEGARLTIDGADVACEREQRHVVMPGRHQIVGKKAGYLTFTQDAVANAGQDAAIDVELGTLEAAVKQRRWAPWKPWAVVGAGAVVALVGIPFQLRASRNIDEYRSAASVCTGDGCVPGSPEYEAVQHAAFHESRGKLENRIAISLWIVGSAVAASGLVTMVVNRERVVIRNTETAVVTPVVSPDAAGLAVIGRF